MKNEMSRIKKAEGKAGLVAATLPWWAKVLIAQHSEAAFPTVDPYRLHHCSDCGCVLISTSAAYRYSPDLKTKGDCHLFSPDLCPECSKKNRSSQGGN